ncbi:MAG TPA: MFS transporter [Steroidobacteraceae bacterium]|nr:MFS transporter [Steroidobacteraceae bacterium]
MQIDLERIIDRSRLGPLQWRVLILCGLVTLLDGYDLQAMASATPALAADWNVTPASLRWVITAALIGIAVSALLLSPLGDYLGRRTMLIGSFAVVAIAMLMTAQAQDATDLIWWRFVTGLGLGASVPNAFAITAEYVPQPRRAAIVALMASGLALGAALCGFVAPYLLDLGGWRMMFTFGGVVMALLCLPLFALPESLRFLVARGRDPRRIGRLVEQLDRSFRHATENRYLIAEHESQGRLSVAQLFSDGRSRATVLLWIVFFINLGLLHLLASWLPTLLKLRELSMGQSLRGAAMFQLGGIGGALLLAVAMRQWSPFRVLVVSYLATVGALLLLAGGTAPVPLLFALVLVTGSGIVGGQAALNALAATMYPTTARSTGVGWALGIGRLGAILAPLFGAALLAVGFSAAEVFATAIVPTLLCAGVVALLGRDALSRQRS